MFTDFSFIVCSILLKYRDKHISSITTKGQRVFLADVFRTCRSLATEMGKWHHFTTQISRAKCGTGPFRWRSFVLSPKWCHRIGVSSPYENDPKEVIHPWVTSLGRWLAALKGERNALDAAEVIWKTENDEAKTCGTWGKTCPRLMMGLPQSINI